jgi:hypothetical protein
MTVRDLVVRLVLNTATFDTSITHSTRQIRSLERTASRVGSSLGDVFGGLGQVMRGDALGGINSVIGGIGKLSPYIAGITGGVALFKNVLESTAGGSTNLATAMQTLDLSATAFARTIGGFNADGFIDQLSTIAARAKAAQNALADMAVVNIGHGIRASEFNATMSDYRMQLFEARESGDLSKAVAARESGLDAIRAGVKDAIDTREKGMAALQAQLNALASSVGKSVKINIESLREVDSLEAKALSEMYKKLKDRESLLNLPLIMGGDNKRAELLATTRKKTAALSGSRAEEFYALHELIGADKTKQQILSIAAEYRKYTEEVDKADNQLRTFDRSSATTIRSIKAQSAALKDAGADWQKEDLSKIDRLFAVRGGEGAQLNRMAAEKQIQVIETKLKYTIDPAETIKLSEELAAAKKRLQQIEDYTLEPLKLKVKIDAPAVPEVPQTILPVDKYAQATSMVDKYNRAIAETSFLYGENSEKTKAITGEVNRLITAYNEANGTNIELVKDGDKTAKDFMSMSEGIKQLGGTVMGISDNPEIKALGISLMILGSMKGIAQAFAEYGPWVGMAVAVATAASVVSAVSTMKGAKFAGGGIVGDQTIIRANEGEMILNSAQQSRLFGYLSGENARGGGTGKVEFVIRGNQLHGVLNNYNEKYK